MHLLSTPQYMEVLLTPHLTTPDPPCITQAFRIIPQGRCYSEHGVQSVYPTAKPPAILTPRYDHHHQLMSLQLTKDRHCYVLCLKQATLTSMALQLLRNIVLCAPPMAAPRCAAATSSAMIFTGVHAWHACMRVATPAALPIHGSVGQRCARHKLCLGSPMPLSTLCWSCIVSFCCGGGFERHACPQGS